MSDFGALRAVQSMAAIVVTSLTLGWSAPVAAQTAFAPAVVVNDDVITYYDVEQRARLLQLNGGAEPGPQLNSAALEGLIDDTLRTQAGERFGLTAAPEAVDAAVDEFAQRLGTDRATAEAQLASLGVSEGALRDFLASQVVWRDLINSRYGSRSTPSELELNQEIELAASGKTQSFRLSEIALPTGQGQDDQARALMQRIVAEARGGSDFAELAKRYSRTPSARNGGDVGWIPLTTLPQALGEMIAATPPGGITDPFEVPGGLSIYKVAETREESPPWARETEMRLQRISITGTGSDAMDAAEELRGEVQGCESIPDLSNRATMESLDQKFVSALPGPVRSAVQFLQAGQASKPVQTGDKVEIFVVCDRSGGMDDAARNQLREQITGARLARFAEGFMQDLRREAVIERR